jgi:hypothetical protein
MPTLVLPRAALLALSTRAAVLWVLVHVFALGLMTLGGTPPSTARLEAPAAGPNPAWIVAVCVALGLVEVRRRGERALWGNLGLSTIHIACLGAIVAALGELLVSLVQR